MKAWPQILVVTAISFFSRSQLALAVTCPETTSPPTCTFVTPTGSAISVAANKQYLQYNGSILPLVGQSASYLCHVEQPGTIPDGTGTTPDLDYCTWANYQSYMGRAPGCAGGVYFCPQPLNVIRLWVGLDHSPGRARGRTDPYCYEQPFAWVSGSAKWHLYDPDTSQTPTWDSTYFDRLRCVVQEAWIDGFIVEVTLFDPWEGIDTTGPWHQPVTAGEPYFRDERCFASLNAVVPGGSACNNYTVYPDHRILHRLQEELIKKVAATLCDYPNVYYEIANELDFNGTPTAAQTQGWYQRMANALIAAEQTCPKADHLFGVSLRDNANIETVMGWTAPTTKLISGHYAQITPSSGTDNLEGAIELLRDHHKSGGGAGKAEIDRVYSFNETKIVGQPNAPAPDTSQVRDAGRAEAWEFMLSEGGVYDQYVDRWQGTESSNATGDLGILRSFLASLPLASMERSPSTTNPGGVPTWITSGLGSYGIFDAQSIATFWGAMQQPNEVYVLFVHHSKVGPGTKAFRRYEPAPGSYSHPSLKLKPNQAYAAANYLIEWFDPATGVRTKNETRCVTLGQEITIASPSYTYDVALRITRTGAC